MGDDFEIMEVITPAAGAVVDGMQCFKCGETIGMDRPIAKVWAEETESSHFICAECLQIEELKG